MSDAPLNDLSAAAERFATVDDTAPVSAPSAVERALPPVLGTLLGGLLLAALGGLTGVLSLGFAAVAAGLVVGGGAAYGLIQLAEQARRRESAAAASRQRERAARHAAGSELVEAIGGALAHVDRLDAERARLHGKVDRLERQLTAKERKIARLQAFDAERRTLEPAPADDPMAGQLTFDAVSE
ncbi:hypothetical protein [Conexibacter woesei]|nr:hypothetical protein [Conexibacter woesei]